MKKSESKFMPYAIFIIAVVSAGIAILDHFGYLGTLQNRFLNYVLLTNGLILGMIGAIFRQTSKTEQKIEDLEVELRKSLLERLGGLHAQADSVLYSIAGTHIVALTERTVRIFADRTLILDDIEIFRTIYKTTLHKFPRSSFLATSIPDRAFFWRNRSIEAAIAEFIRGGGHMKRIFFLSGEQDLKNESVQQTLRIQHKIGVEVMTVSTHEVPLHLQRFFFVDASSRIAWEPVRGPDNKIKSIQITADKAAIESYRRMFDQLVDLDATHPYVLSYVGLDPHKTRADMKTPINAAAFSAFENQGWQQSADPYHKYFGPLTGQVADKLLDSILGTVSATSLLDIATGPGYLARKAKQHGVSKVVGIDFSEVMVSLAKSLDGGVDYQVGDAESLTIEDASFQAVTMNFGLLHLAQPDLAINQAYRVLMPEGRFGFTVWSEPRRAIGFAIILAGIEAFADTNVEIPEGPPFFYFSSSEHCIAVLSAAGFKNPSVKELDFIWELESANQLFEAFLTGTARTGGLLRAQTDDVLRSIRQSVVKDAERYLVNGRLKIPMSAVIATGNK